MRSAAVVLIVQDGLILSISRRYDISKFGLVGGKCEPNETPKEAAIRECLEETGVSVEECEFIYRRDEPKDREDGEDFHTYCFYATKWSGTPSMSEEGKVEWLTAYELTHDKAAFADYNAQTLKAFKEKFPNVVLK